jgi:hypothetical protein
VLRLRDGHPISRDDHDEIRLLEDLRRAFDAFRLAASMRPTLVAARLGWRAPTAGSPF